MTLTRMIVIVVYRKDNKINSNYYYHSQFYMNVIIIKVKIIMKLF